MDEAEDSREKVKRIQVQHHDEEGWLQSGETGNMKTELIYEDREILVVYKPAGFATQTAGIGQADVVSELKNYIWQTDRKTEQTKPAGNTQPYLGVIHRLDQPVEGLLVFARNARAAAHLSRQLQRQDAEGGFCKDYGIIVKRGKRVGGPQSLSAVSYLADSGQAGDRPGGYSTGNREVSSDPGSDGAWGNGSSGGQKVRRRQKSPDWWGAGHSKCGALRIPAGIRTSCFRREDGVSGEARRKGIFLFFTVMND